MDPEVSTTLSPYGYVLGNPLNETDQSGDCGLWGSDTCWGDGAQWVDQHASAISAVSGALALIPEPLSPVFAIVSAGTGGLAAYNDFSHGNVTVGALDLLAAIPGVGALGAARYADWLAEAAEGSSALMGAAYTAEDAAGWSAEGLDLTACAGFWAATSGVLGGGATANATWALLFSSEGLGWGTCLL